MIDCTQLCCWHSWQEGGGGGGVCGFLVAWLAGGTSIDFQIEGRDGS